MDTPRKWFWLLSAVAICCLLLSGCTASFCLNTRLFDYYATYTDTNTHITEQTKRGWSPSTMAPQGFYSTLMMSYKENDTTEGVLKLHGSIEQERERRDFSHYYEVSLLNIQFIVNRKDTLSWMLDKARASICDSVTKYTMWEGHYGYRSHYRNSVVINNYTRDSLPWRIPTSAKDSNWRTSFEMTTEPIDIRKARKLRIELTFQVDNITIKRVIKARRHFLIWFEPRQGFRWIAPEDIDLLESII